MKDEREVLTRQIILEKLVYEAKRSMVDCLLVSFLGAVIFGMLCLIFLTQPYVTTTSKVLVSLLISSYFIGCAFFFVRALLRMFKAKRGDFTVFEDVLTSVEDNKFSLIQFIFLGARSKYHLRHVFQFRSGKKFIANAGEYINTRLATSAEFSLPGDVFITVFYNDAPNKIILLFTSKTYVYKKDN